MSTLDAPDQAFTLWWHTVMEIPWPVHAGLHQSLTIPLTVFF